MLQVLSCIFLTSRFRERLRLAETNSSIKSFQETIQAVDP